MALASSGCATSTGVRGADIKRPLSIEGVCEDPPEVLAEGLFWVRPPCTLIVRNEVR